MKNKKSLEDMLRDSLTGHGKRKKISENDENGRAELGHNPTGDAGDATEIKSDGIEGKTGKRPRNKLSEKQKTQIALKRLLRKILIIAVTVILLLTFVIGVTIWHDNNMFPNVKDGDLAITFKLTGYYNGDIVIYKQDGIKRMGRVVGIPGDTIDIANDGTYTINDTVPYETIYFATKPAAGSQVKYPYTVQEGELFVFNDMRDDTNDSRMFGAIIKPRGKVVLLLRRRGF